RRRTLPPQSRRDQFLILRRPQSVVAGASRTQAGRPVSRAASRSARLLRNLSVAVASERRTRRRHGGCVCSLGERGDRNQRDQRESSEEFPHDTSPCYRTLTLFAATTPRVAMPCSHQGDRSVGMIG